MPRSDVMHRASRSTQREKRSAAKGPRLRETEQELAEALQQQVATADVLRVISRSHFDLKAVLDTLVMSVSRLCNVQATAIVQQTGEKLLEVASYGYSPEYTAYMRNYPYELGRGTVVGRTLVESRAVQIEDVLADAEYTLIEGQRLGGFRTVLGVPLLREGEAIGVIVLSRNTVQRFTERQIALVTTFADQAVIAIENTHLLDELRHRSRDLQEALDYQTATGDVLNVISRSPSETTPVFDVIVKTAAKLCTAEYAFIARPRDGHCPMVAANNVALAHIQFLLQNPPPINRDSILGRVTIDGRTIHVPDVLDDPEFKRHDWQNVGKQRTVLGVPLNRDGKLLGVLILARTRVQPFTEKQVNLVTTFADQAVIAIENARLFEEVQARTGELGRSVEELRALGEVSHAVNSTLDLETVLRTIVTKAVELSVTAAGAIYVFSHLRQKFRLRATYGMSEEMIADISQHKIGPGESYIGQATERGEALQIPDLEAEQASVMRDLVLQAGYRALLVVPLLRPDSVVGALVVRRRDPGPFRASIVSLLQTFATQSVLAIQNARLFEEAEARRRELAKSLDELKAAQDRLIQTEKLASLGQLTAGIAHEIKNPLNFVNNFAALSVELLDELKVALTTGAQSEGIKEEIGNVMALLAGNLERIVQHGRRADSIVKNMLLHSRTGSGDRQPTDVNAIVEESINLAYHGARAAEQDFNITIERSLDPTAGVADLYAQEITRVLLNLISNSFHATMQRKRDAPGGYEPLLRVETRSLGDSVEIGIEDNGTGIAEDIKEKLFTPFFTTKPPGEGTGLGLSLSHDIVVKQHGGTIAVKSQADEFTALKIVLPRRAMAGAG